ncbi:hypothetical protein C8J57DRAFT_1335639 [Mycena rebaudengoi]|nr:hypothetical protein C8J57DRAFT_1335639 [Mycena rebaudengoi]
MNYTIEATDFTNYWDFALLELYGTAAEVVLYGILLVLFAFSGYLLYYRESAGRRTLSFATCAMVVLATLQLVMRVLSATYAFRLFRLAVQGEFIPYSILATVATQLYNKFIFVENILLVTNNVVTDGLFIYRCFLIWGRNIYVIAVPIAMLCTTTVTGYLCSYTDEYSPHPYLDPRAAFIMSVLTNVLLMILTAGRIWWRRRDARIVLESKFVKRYDMVIAVILESGAIYCICVVIYVICCSITIRSLTLFNIVSIFRGALPQIMNIAPTLIVVRVGLGHDAGAVLSDAERLYSRRPVGRSGPGQVHSSPVLDIRSLGARHTEADIPFEESYKYSGNT